MHTSEFDFILPPDLIAQEPAHPRDACRLMVLNRNLHTFEHKHFYDLPLLLRKGDVLVMNNSRVLPARIRFLHDQKQLELFLLRHDTESCWFALGKPAKILQPGQIFTIAPGFSFKIVEILPDGQRYVRFLVPPNELEGLIKKYGDTPLPPYIKHSHSKPEDYQTVYARPLGSVAAPTAGLHFTNELLERLKNMGIKIVFVTLHVGLGTFQPIRSNAIEDHTMHSEIFELSTDAANELQKARQDHRRIIAVGTTSVRVLESSYDSLKGFTAQVGGTSIYIYPGYHWKCVDALITNFHLPQSTLLLLTSSFGGKDFIKKAYQEAIHQRYRFYSFGDAMIIF